MAILKMADLDLKGKRVLIRADLNVPLKDGKVASDKRIMATLPTIKLALEKGANVLIQAGGGCRYGYYAELEEKILRDLGYDFEFYNMIEDDHISLVKGYRFVKKMNKKIIKISIIFIIFSTTYTFHRQQPLFLL